MKLCRTCDRHVLSSEAACPFCGTSLPSTRAPLAPLGLALGLMTAACGPSTSDDGESGAADSSGSSSEATPVPVTLTTASSSSSSASASASTTMEPEATSSSTASPDDSSADQGGSFYAGPPDGGTGRECDLQAQDCPEGEKCMPWANDGGPFPNDQRCTPIAENPGQDGAPCLVEGSPSSGIDDCDLGLVCAEVDAATNQGVCRALCDPGGAAFCSDPDLSCVGWFHGWLPICSPLCDPLLDECAPGLACYGNPDVVCDHANCGYAPPPGTGMQGDPCEFANECAPGLQCASGMGVPGCASLRCCTATCDVSDPTSCDAVPGTSCEFADEPGRCPPQIYFAGVCTSP